MDFNFLLLHWSFRQMCNLKAALFFFLAQICLNLLILFYQWWITLLVQWKVNKQRVYNVDANSNNVEHGNIVITIA